MELTLLEITLRLSAAMGAAAIVGWERESKNRSAGLRTHVLVALGACLFTVIGLDLASALKDLSPNQAPDPLRVIDGVVGGIGFLGAGAILRGNGRVHGLTTAAGIWVVAAIGVAAGCGRYQLVAISAVFVFVTLFVLRRLQTHAFDHKKRPMTEERDPETRSRADDD